MVKLAEIFTDHMVLQRDKEIRFFGTAQGEDEITVNFCGEQCQTILRDECWEAVFPPKKEGGPFWLDVYGRDAHIHRTDIFIGEVWVAAGQSNMAMTLEECSGGAEELEKKDNSELRYYIQAGISDDGTEEQEGTWRACTEGNFGDISAVAYYCGLSLQQKLHVPVGIIVCSHPGTSIDCWRDVTGPVLPENLKEERKNQYMFFWEEKEKGSQAWPPPVWEGSPFWPGTLFGKMVKRIAPYNVRGVLYYQGEEDCRQPDGYAEKMKSLVKQWRELWRDQGIYFIEAQLPIYGGEEQVPQSWALLRKEQEIAADETDHMDMAVLMDCGDEGDIHPLDKKKPGERMALHCMQAVYKNTEIKPEPRFSEAVRLMNGHILIRFKGGNGNLRADTQGSNKNLEAAGQDGIFYPAEYNICGREIEVWCKQTERIQFVRYAFHNCVKVDLFDEAGLPVAPFFIELT